MLMIDQIVITDVFPCIADSTKIRFHAQPSADLTEVLPYLNAVMPGAVYNHDLPALTITREHRIISLYPRRITCAKADDIDDAHAIIEWLRNLISDTWARREHIQPSYARRQRLSALDIYKLLPETNCGRCGEFTCLAFAVRLAGQEATAQQCAPLLEGQQPEKRALLAELLTAAGYPIPEAWQQTQRTHP